MFAPKVQSNVRAKVDNCLRTLNDFPKMTGQKDQTMAQHYLGRELSTFSDNITKTWCKTFS